MKKQIKAKDVRGNHICYQNNFVLNLYSSLKRSPSKLLKEIILVDDFSDNRK